MLLLGAGSQTRSNGNTLCACSASYYTNHAAVADGGNVENRMFANAGLDNLVCFQDTRIENVLFQSSL